MGTRGDRGQLTTVRSHDDESELFCGGGEGPVSDDGLGGDVWWSEVVRPLRPGLFALPVEYLIHSGD